MKSLGLARLVVDPQVKSNDVVTFRIAYDTGYGDNKKSTFMNCIAFKKVGEVIAKNVAKGQMLFFEGQVQDNSYEKEGVKIKDYQMVINSFSFVGDKKPSDRGNSDFNGNTETGSKSGSGSTPSSLETKYKAETGVNITTDQIPF